MSDKVNGNVADIGKKARQDYQDRVRHELAELAIRCEKLEDFLESEVFEGLDMGQKKLLIGQLIAMSNYRSFLEIRIELFDAQVQDPADDKV